MIIIDTAVAGAIETMPRPHKCRRITAQPGTSCFKPAGIAGPSLTEIELRLDELEALRLADLEGLYHDAAAERMGVSRPTFGRLVATARHKVADALVNSRMLTFKGGHTTMTELRRFQCGTCGTAFEVPCGTGRPTECPTCHSKSLGRCRRRGAGAGAGGQRRQTRGKRPRSGRARQKEHSPAARFPSTEGE